MKIADSQWYPWKLCLIKYELDFDVYNFRLLVLYKSDLCILLQEMILELSELNILKLREATISSKYLIKSRFQGFRWKSGIFLQSIPLNTTIFYYKSSYAFVSIYIYKVVISVCLSVCAIKSLDPFTSNCYWRS